MNAGSNTGSTGVLGAGSGLKTALGAVFFVGIIVGLYYLYKFLYGSSAGNADISLLDGSKSMTATTTDSSIGKTIVTRTDMTGILDGGQYSVNFWAYVADAKGFANSNKLAHLFEISNKRFASTGAGKTMLFVGLNPLNGALVVRQTADSDTELTNTATNNLLTNFASASATTTDDRCDILNGIEYQRWVMVTCIGNGRTLDVYLDGKLARSCVYKGNYALGSVDGSAQAYFGMDNNNNLKGFFANGRYYNYALTPDAVWSLYQGGPSGYFTIGNFFKNLFNVDVSFEKTANLNP